MFKDVLGTSRVERTQCKADGENHCHFMIVFEEEKIKSK
jgi:predicted hydrocarbon binding protein